MLICHSFFIDVKRFVRKLRKIYRVFTKEIRLSDAHHFINQVDKTKSRKQCEMEFEDAKNDLLNWGLSKRIETQNLRTLALHYLTEVLQNHDF
jgi:hypothetical protein